VTENKSDELTSERGMDKLVLTMEEVSLSYHLVRKNVGPRKWSEKFFVIENTAVILR